MSASTNRSLAPTAHRDEPAKDGLLLQLASLAWAIIASPQRFVLCSLPTGTILVISAIAVGQVRLNTWQGGLHDALQQHEFQAFIAELITFSGIAGALLALVVAQTWLTEMFKVKLRGWLTRDLLDEWLHSKRAYLFGFAGEIGNNPDQRIHEDARHLAELSADLLQLDAQLSAPNRLFLVQLS